MGKQVTNVAMINSKALADGADILPAIRTEAAKRYARRSKSDNTLRAYRAAWREFEAFAEQRNESSLPAQPETVIEYLVALAEAGAKVSTIGVKLAAIKSAHDVAKIPSPTRHNDVEMIMAGIRRKLGTAPQKKSPVTLAELQRMIATVDTSKLMGLRDRALVLIGYAGGFRRSELVAVNVGDLRWGDGVLRIKVRKSKTDQQGKGYTKTIPAINVKALDPLRALRSWLDTADIKSGAVFRRVDRWGHTHKRLTSQSVARVVKAQAGRAGLDPRQFAGHSLRSGFITQAANEGILSRDIAQQTGQTTATLEGYIQDAGVGASVAVRAAFGEGK